VGADEALVGVRVLLGHLGVEPVGPDPGVGLHQPVVELDRQADALRHRLRGLPGPRQRARPEHLQAQACYPGREVLGLLLPGVVKGNVHLALEPAGVVVGGLAVPGEVDGHVAPP
jgi:hypothetical protein